MRRLYAILIHVTVALGIATVWAIGRDMQAQEFLERARRAAAVPYEPTEFEAAEFAAAAAPSNDVPRYAARATPATRPASPEANPVRRAAQVDTGGLVP